MVINCSELTGILINGQYGSQNYDPFDSKDIAGGLQLGLPRGVLNAAGTSAVVDTRCLAYFVGSHGEMAGI
jgi:hypothetical protein